MSGIIRSNGFPLLTDTGSISHVQMEQTTSDRYADYDQHRKVQEAIAADHLDAVALSALEAKIKKRTQD